VSGGVDRPVHPRVELGVIGAPVAAALQVLEQSEQGFAVVRRGPLRGQGCRQALELHADLGEPGLVGDVDPGDARPAPGVGDRQLFQCQSLQRIADRGEPQSQGGAEGPARRAGLPAADALPRWRRGSVGTPDPPTVRAQEPPAPGRWSCSSCLPGPVMVERCKRWNL